MEHWIDDRTQTWRTIILAHILRGRQWLSMVQRVQLPIFGHEIVGEWVGECRTEEAQDKSTKKEGYGVGHDLCVDRAETHIMPIEGGTIRSAEQERTDPVAGTEDRDQGPGIVEKGAYHERKKVQAQGPGAEEYHDGV